MLKIVGRSGIKIGEEKGVERASRQMGEEIDKGKQERRASGDEGRAQEVISHGSGERERVPLSQVLTPTGGRPVSCATDDMRPDPRTGGGPRLLPSVFFGGGVARVAGGRERRTV
ncbi:hypothetical protein AB0451_40330 [Streptomyces sp. NPDC052000]|uniref:hypothetical protein n=1 Tax=Streptomyces sp. NPDC052000 TaxID=3155676 RepID=UPI00345011C4